MRWRPGDGWRGALRRMLHAVGLLEPAFRLRDLWRSVGDLGRAPAVAADGLPIPPAHLRHLVAGTADVDWFLSSGRNSAASIGDLLARHGVALKEIESILDFGCGCGRVIRHWAGLAARIQGVDRNRRLVRWCRRHLPFASFDMNRVEPPLRGHAGEFQLVYALSVFSHLPEGLQRPWIEELRRVTRVGGHVIFSIHGESYRETLTDEERRRFDEGRLVVRAGEAAGRNVCGAFHPPSYTRQLVVDGLEMVEHVPEGATGNPRQDLILLRRV